MGDEYVLSTPIVVTRADGTVEDGRALTTVRDDDDALVVSNFQDLAGEPLLLRNGDSLALLPLPDVLIEEAT